MAAGARVSKAQQAYDAIKNRIVDGTYGPGARLVLDQLARDLSVSPVPIREAVRRLEAEGWVVFKHNVGAQVASIDLPQYGQVMETLALLEGYATARAMPYIDEALLEDANKLNVRMRESIAAFDPMAFTALNHDFHVLLCGRCPNVHLSVLLERQWQQVDRLGRSTFSVVPGRAQQSVDEHGALLELIGSGVDPSVVEAAAREHKLSTLRALAAHY